MRIGKELFICICMYVHMYAYLEIHTCLHTDLYMKSSFLKPDKHNLKKWLSNVNSKFLDCI